MIVLKSELGLHHEINCKYASIIIGWSTLQFLLACYNMELNSLKIDRYSLKEQSVGWSTQI